jgi:hypothetical protein
MHSWAAAAAVGVMAVIGGCAPNVSAPPLENVPPATIEPPFPGAAVLPPPDMTDDGPGSLLEVKPLEGMQEFDEVNATGVRVVYRSTDSKGAATQVSGVVFVPPGDPPSGGWPVLSVGHAETGVQKECAPSAAKDLGGYSSRIASLVDRGYVLAMTDYQGLGLDGFPHPLLDSVTLGNNMIDAVRAARHVVPAASNRWAAMGFGQGGMAAWGANAHAATYGAGLDLVGAVALSPWSNVTGLADAMENETLPPAQYRLALLVLASLAFSPDYKLDPYDYLSGAAEATVGKLISCGVVVEPLTRVAAEARLQPSDFKPETPEAAAKLRSILQGFALPGPSALSAPMLLFYATDDEFLPPAWIELSLRSACARGEPVEVMKRLGDTNTFNDIVTYDAVAWIQGRFAGQRVANVCVGV